MLHYYYILPFITLELATITAERDKLLVEMQELAQTIANLQQGKRSHELELEDMLNAYKKALSHSRQIEAELENFRFVFLLLIWYILR